jgi:hypothetical protein
MSSGLLVTNRMARLPATTEIMVVVRDASCGASAWLLLQCHNFSSDALREDGRRRMDERRDAGVRRARVIC